MGKVKKGATENPLKVTPEVGQNQIADPKVIPNYSGENNIWALFGHSTF